MIAGVAIAGLTLAERLLMYHENMSSECMYCAGVVIADLTLAERLLMETKLICIGTSVAVSACMSSSPELRLARSRRCTISAARQTRVSLSDTCKQQRAVLLVVAVHGGSLRSQ